MDSTRIVFQNTVADISALSRYGASSDLAVVTSTVLFAEDPSEQAVASMRGEVVGERRGRLMTVRNEIEIPAVDNDVFRFDLSVPEKDSGAIVKNGATSVVIMLPPNAVFDGEDVYEVELTDYTKEPVPRVFGVYDLPSVANRIVVAWYAREDPDVNTQYVYRRITSST